MNTSFDYADMAAESVGSELLHSNDDVHDTTTTTTTTSDDIETYIDDGKDDNNFESNLRRRKGKIISCAKETFEQASRQFRRKVPYAGHLMAPRRLWLNKIPTLCDVVIEFPEDAPDEALRWLLARIRSQPSSGSGLIVQVKAHESTRRNAFYVSATTTDLFKAAEEARLPKRLRPDLGGVLREFTTRESHCFEQFKNEDGSTVLFSSQERQWLVLQVLQGLRAGQNDVEALQGRAHVAEGQSIVAAWQECGIIAQIFPLHETRSLAKLQSSWVRQILAPQPLDDISEYFGVKVALYFAWLGHYTCALGVPAIFGSILYTLLWGRTQMIQDMGHVLFSLFNVAWASLYLEAWKRYSVELAFRWGTLSMPPELLEPPRPLYKGPLVENIVTGRLEPKEAPAWKRRAFRYLVSFPIIGICLLMVFVVMFLMLRFQDWLDSNNIPERGITQCIFNLHKNWWDSKLPEESFICCLSVIPKVLLAGAITLMDEAYYKLAVWLNDRENYRLQSKYENHLIAKVALFQFVNSFLSLFYIAFYLRDEEKLKEQLAGLLISRQIIGNIRESALPYVFEQWKLAKLSFNMWGALSPTQNLNRIIVDNDQDTNAATNQQQQQPSNPNKRNIGQAEIESSLYKYDGTFSDHLEMLVQMGYVVLFSSTFPLAGICALVNNLMEIRSDAFKLTHVHQRPFGQRVANIGTWQNAFSILSLVAIIVNCALIGLSGQVSRIWPGLTTVQTIILIVTLEHIMLGLRSALTWLLPELPSWLAAEIARAEHSRREMQCKGTSPRPTPPTPSSEISYNLRDVVETPIKGHLDDNAILHDDEQQTESVYDDITKSGVQRNIEADVNIFEKLESSPDSPPSQTSTVLARPKNEFTPTSENYSINSDILLHDTALRQANILNSSSTRSSMHLPEIPPFRKKSNDSATGSSASSSPQLSGHIMRRQLPSTSSPTAAKIQIYQHQPASTLSYTKIPDIPAFRSRKISAESTMHLPTSAKNAMKSHAPEWMSRLKVIENVSLHRSIDCIAKELKSRPDTTETVLNAAPSCSNVAKKSSAKIVASSSSSSSGGSANVGVTRSLQPIESAISTTSLDKEENQGKSSNANESTSDDKVTGNGGATANSEKIDDIAKEEWAAKKSRLKQKLVKSARSVAIFSLKLKERRQREAEKAATIAIEHAKQLAKLPPQQYGGELSLIPIEQLIQIEDLQQMPIRPRTTSTASSTSTGASTSKNIRQQQQHHQ